MASIIDGKALAERYRVTLHQQIQEQNIEAGLAMVLVGQNPASRIYVGRKKQMCERVGIRSFMHEEDDTITQDALIALVQKLNHDPKTHGILIQLPLPAHIDSFQVLTAINPLKDVDGLHPVNLGHLMWNKSALAPCTPQGCVQLIQSVLPSLQGKKVAIIGRSVLVGKTTAMLLLHQDATVTLLHSKAEDLAAQCREAEILVSAIGVPKKITRDYIKPGAIVIDVGISQTEHGIAGDVDFEDVQGVAGYVTPVPGGVGPMTVMNLMLNTIKAYHVQKA